jgi:hypothetical protein
MFHVCITVCCAYDRLFAVVCRYVMVRSPYIFECGEEKQKLDAQNSNQTHAFLLITDGTLFPGIQTNMYLCMH